MRKLIHAQTNLGAKIIALLLAVALWFLIKKNIETRNPTPGRYYIKPPDAGLIAP